MSKIPGSDLTDGQALEQFTILAKSAKGKACEMLIQQALEAPNVFVFGELLENKNLEQNGGALYELLKLFAYGTYSEYKANQSKLPPLNEKLIKKLRQLTLVTLSSENKVIPYATLQQRLEISNVRELEDLIIDSIYANLIGGKLDQKSKHLEVDFTIGRDLRPNQIDAMLGTLSNWCSEAERLTKIMEDRMKIALHNAEEKKKHKQEFEKKVEETKVSLKQHAESEMMDVPGDFESPEYMDNKMRMLGAFGRRTGGRGGGGGGGARRGRSKRGGGAY